METKNSHTIPTAFTKMMGCRYPIIAAPMFLVSNEDLVVEVSENGGVGTLPSLNFRPAEEFRNALTRIKARTDQPIGVNLIVNASNRRQHEDLKSCLDLGVELIITSLGNPKEVIQEAHKQGTKVICDVTNLSHAEKVQDQGADGVIAVCRGAGGHAGPLSPFSLVPWLKEKLEIPIALAGGIGGGSTMAASLALGADAVSVGTRFIACKEATVRREYKEAIINSSPEDIVMTTKISGTPAAVINTEYINKIGTDLHWALKILKSNKRTKKYITPLIHLLGMRSLERSATNPSWKSVWSAGETVGQIHEELTAKEILDKFIREYEETLSSLPR
ncbi:nitronate monooxygenase [Bdellovibrionales bacterium]|nr:nitronate monooxygenase [Bdellovibrionales bacterium]